MRYAVLLANMLVLITVAYSAAQIRIPISWLLTDSGNPITNYSCTNGAFCGFDAAGAPLCCSFVSSAETGSAGYLAKWASSTSLANSIIYDNGTNVGIGTATPSYKLDVSGDIRATNNIRSDSGFCIGNDCISSWGEVGGVWEKNGSNIYYNNGNVGIRTTSPMATLDVNGSFRVVASSSSPAFLGGWQYRKDVKIVNTLDQDLIDYPVKVVIDTATLISQGKMRNDCGDIRFTRQDGVTLIPYWIEGGCNTSQTVIWVKVPEIPATDEAKVYLYYGNPSATSESNGEAVFTFFDDFDSGLSKWNNVGYPSPGTFSDASFHDGWGYATNGDATDNSGSHTKSLFDVTNGLTVRFRVKQLAGDTWDMFYTIGVGRKQSGYTDSSYDYYFGVRIHGDNPDGHVDYSRDIVYQVYGGTQYVEDYANDLQFHVYEIKFDGSSCVTFYKDGTQVHSTCDIAAPPYNTLPLYIAGRDYHNTNYLDYILIRKFASAEPSVSVSPYEETPSPKELLFSVSNYGVGIGTADPSATLDVNGDIHASGALLSSVSTSTLSVGGEATISGKLTAGELNVDNGTLYVDPSTHRVGIGTTSPSYDLDVNGSANAKQLCIDGDCVSSWSDVAGKNIIIPVRCGIRGDDLGQLHTYTGLTQCTAPPSCPTGWTAVYTGDVATAVSGSYFLGYYEVFCEPPPGQYSQCFVAKCAAKVYYSGGYKFYSGSTLCSAPPSCPTGWTAVYSSNFIGSGFDNSDTSPQQHLSGWFETVCCR